MGYRRYWYVMVGLNVFAAETDTEARRLFTWLQQAFVNLRRGLPGRLLPPVDGFDSQIEPWERAMLEQALACSVVGSPATVRSGLKQFMDRTRADELIIAAQIFDHAARLRSYEITALAREELVRADRAER